MSLSLNTEQLNTVRDCIETGEDLPDELYQLLFEHYLNNGEMPYGTAKARDGDPFQWIHDKLPEVLNESIGSSEAWKPGYDTFGGR